ncbi:MAG TPA: sigma-70 family RNA polymerase sigma factor [Rhizomicrobium sp.]|nr:sigma-70 family RNA polymerase sigma factor [Rhizomicrobium sp.]
MDRSPCAGTAPLRLEELILRGRSGDRPALTELIRLYQTRMARFVIGQTADENHFEDLCQAIFVKMVLALPNLRAADRFEPWLFQIARNICRDHLRAGRGWRRLFAPLDPDCENVVGETTAVQSNEAGDLGRGLAQLPSEQRRLLELSLDSKRSHEELAAMTGTTISSVKSRLFRARENLRGILLAGNRK